MLFKQFIRNRDGASIVEFAIVAPIFFLLIMGIIEFGLFMFHKVAIEAITMQVAREASLNSSSGYSNCNGGNDRYAYIRCYVREKASSLINGEQVQVNINTVAQGGTTVPDICLNTDPPSSTPATCAGGQGYEEVNGLPGYQGASSINRPGSAGELIEVRVSYPWRVLVPFMSKIIGSEQPPAKAGDPPTRTGVVMITSSTVFRNEPAATTP